MRYVDSRCVGWLEEHCRSVFEVGKRYDLAAFREPEVAWIEHVSVADLHLWQPGHWLSQDYPKRWFISYMDDREALLTKRRGGLLGLAVDPPFFEHSFCDWRWHLA
jgi:hypothetical protein